MTEMWYACDTVPQKERAVSEAMSRLGFTPWIPTHKVRKRTRRKPAMWDEVDRPIIPSLVFVNADCDLTGCPDVWHRLASVRHMRGVIGVRGVPVFCTSAEIDRMAERAGQKAALDMERARVRRVSVGEVVTIRKGAMIGFEGTVTEIKGHRAKVMLQLFGAIRDIDVPIAEVEQVA